MTTPFALNRFFTYSEIVSFSSLVNYLGAWIGGSSIFSSWINSTFACLLVGVAPFSGLEAMFSVFDSCFLMGDYSFSGCCSFSILYWVLYSCILSINYAWRAAFPAFLSARVVNPSYVMISLIKSGVYCFYKIFFATF